MIPFCSNSFYEKLYYEILLFMLFSVVYYSFKIKVNKDLLINDSRSHIKNINDEVKR